MFMMFATQYEKDNDKVYEKDNWIVAMTRMTWTNFHCQLLPFLYD